MKTNRTYAELISLPTFIERFRYLELKGRVGEETFGHDRWLNQMFYNLPDWESTRRQVIIRDGGRDLAMDGYDIPDGVPIYVHHLNPITKEDILERNPDIFDPNYLVCVSDRTHRAIHYGDEKRLPQDPIERRKNDTCPWKH